jgi:hypothetical protein
MVVRNTRYVNKHLSASHIIIDLPTCIDPAYWSRHSLSMDDVYAIVQHVPTHYLWLMVLSYGGSCTWTSVRISHAHVFDTVVSGRNVAISTLIESSGYRPHTSKHRCENIYTDSALYNIRHIPPLPRHTISLDVFDIARRNLVVFQYTKGARDIDNAVVPTMYIPETVSYLGHQWAITSIEGDCVCATRVVTVSDANDTLDWGTDMYYSDHAINNSNLSTSGARISTLDVHAMFSSFVARSLVHPLRQVTGRLSSGRTVIITDECVLLTPLH